MRPLRVAVTGGIGAGKSEVLRAFARRGVPTLSADEIVHDLIAADPDVRAALEDRFGTTDRSRIGEIVFTDSGELEWLEPDVEGEVRDLVVERATDVFPVCLQVFFGHGCATALRAVG